VELPSLEEELLEGNVHYLRLRTFTQRGAQELRKVLRGILGSHGTILDLRGNGGGVLDAAVEMHGLFAGPGPVTWILDRQGRRKVRSTNQEALSSPPTVILMDRDTASAAEVLAASLHRHGSLLVGEPSYGKGSIQEVTPLADGGAAVLTVAHYEIAPGHLLPASGLVPDRKIDLGPPHEIPFPPSLSKDPGLRQALRIVLGPRSKRQTEARRSD
jgi:carboxyl-terminal processing protease